MYILNINIHGLVRGEQVEFGRDADTGGQTKYVTEQVRYLSKLPQVDRIDLVTRLIKDKRVSEIYSKPEETLTEKASIIRIPCGGYKYLSKEKLWDTLDEFTDNLIKYIRKQDTVPDIVHGHYADSGYVASQVARTFGIPFVFTAHSLGRNKLSFLKQSGLSYEQAVKKYVINTRIDTEEELLAGADLVIASTKFEQEELYGQYEHKNIPRFAVIPPGLELEKFFPYYHYEVPGNDISEEAKQAHIRTLYELRRFHFEPEKPLILSLCRPDARKNIDLLIDIYGKDKELQAMANLAIFAGIRQDISKMEEGEQQVLTDILLAMDKYDLYGKMAIPKFHDTDRDVPELYRIAALKRGVFVSASHLETFGLTFIEASAAGLPFVATNKGGPVDIVNLCGSGLLADINDPSSIAHQIKQILTDANTWNTLSEQGINSSRNIYTWEHHCSAYVAELEKLLKNSQADIAYRKVRSIGKRLASIQKVLITDIDDTLIGGNQERLQELLAYLEEQKDHIGFGVATGRSRESAIKVLSEYGIDHIDILISSVGTELCYENLDTADRGWSAHISKSWKPDKIRSVLSVFRVISLQEESGSQRPFKISYTIHKGVDAKELIPEIHKELDANNIKYQLIFSHGSFIDILPYRASKGHAIRYISRKWNIPLQHIITAGNSGNDRDMLTGRIKGIVVGNHEPELASLRKNSSIYFSRQPHAGGILEGLRYWTEAEHPSYRQLSSSLW